MKTKCNVCTVMCDISRGNELRACAFEHNGDENICPFDARYLDLSEHDKQVRSETIDEFVESLREKLFNDGRYNIVTENDIDDVAEKLKERRNDYKND